MSHLVLSQLTKTYAGGSDAVRGVSFMATQGEFIVLVGPSGCGKSTTLRMIAGLEEATSGDILIGGKRVNDLAPKDRDVAMVFQNYALYPHLSVYENIAFPLLIKKTDKAIIDREVRSVAELLSINRLLDRKPKELSGGERQRVALGRAIVRKPQVFLFDEPLSNLDAALRTEMRAELKSLQQRLGTTMVYVTHDQTEAMTMGDTIVVMNKGLVEQTGSPREIYETPKTAFVARFLGAPTINMIKGTLKTIGENTLFTSGGFSIPIAGISVEDNREVFLGIRPESFMVGTCSTDSNATIEGTVLLVERLGSVTHCYIEYPSAERGKIAATLIHHETKPQIGDRMSIIVREQGLHIFDAATGVRL